MNERYAIGTDVGGSHISAVLMDLEKGDIIQDTFSTQKINNKDTAENILSRWALAIKETIGGVNPDELSGIGFAMPGPFDYEQGIALFERVDKYESLYGVNIGERLGSLLGMKREVPFRFMNDATSFAVGESWVGKAAEYKRSVAITLGTGFGSAFIESGIPVLDRDDVPEMGCVWHLPFKEGIADDYFSTRWFINSYKEKTGKVMPGVKEIAYEALSDGLAAGLFREFGTNLGEFLGPWLKRFNAECLVIGGNMTGAIDLFGPFMELAFKQLPVDIDIHLSELKETAAMVGSARLMKADFWNDVKPLLTKM
jgi:Transcriptional regulator/sugar kinase